MTAPVEGPDLGELARLEAASTEHLHAWERRCRAAESRAQRRCVARAEVRADAPEITALVAEIRQWRNAAPFLLAQAAAVERVRALCDEYRANCDPTSTQAQVAELFRDTLDGRSE